MSVVFHHGYVSVITVHGVIRGPFFSPSLSPLDSDSGIISCECDVAAIPCSHLSCFVMEHNHASSPGFLHPSDQSHSSSDVPLLHQACRAVGIEVHSWDVFCLNLCGSFELQGRTEDINKRERHFFLHYNNPAVMCQFLRPVFMQH